MKGLPAVTDACAAITGMSPVFNMSSMTPSATTSTLPLNARAYGNSAIRGDFKTFGHPLDFFPHRFALYVWTTGKTPVFFGKDEDNFDLTLQVDTAPDPRRVHLVIDSLDLTKGGEDFVLPGGFQPGFGEWNENNEDIQL